MKCDHLYRSAMAGWWYCIRCRRRTVAPPPRERMASYRARLAAEARR